MPIKFNPTNIYSNAKNHVLRADCLAAARSSIRCLLKAGVSRHNLCRAEIVGGLHRSPLKGSKPSALMLNEKHLTVRYHSKNCLTYSAHLPYANKQFDLSRMVHWEED
ncbi:hypothetical protein BD410DRAFT_845877 [Rickenella mellea]|uniref:Uncharacterized protein n=1 Tax=Rickenella mellea TaxID=50990 RepID=A0A4Y7PGN7_9AGAM|nr:hypothetical protein BD410DRAFT_845877 [Rickenella mellea]